MHVTQAQYLVHPMPMAQCCMSTSGSVYRV